MSNDQEQIQLSFEDTDQTFNDLQCFLTVKTLWNDFVAIQTLPSMPYTPTYLQIKWEPL